MKIIEYPLSEKQWIATKTKKTHIVLHGSFSRSIRSPFQGDGRESAIIDTWNANPEKYGCAYLIGLNGDVYSTFPEDEWAYHLQLKSYYDKISIGVCFVNELYLNKSNTGFYAFGIDKPHNYYNGEVLEQKFRGYNYYAKLTDAQITSAKTLIGEICERQKIKVNLYRGDEFNPKVWDTNTIFTHSVVNKNVYDLPFDERL